MTKKYVFVRMPSDIYAKYVRVKHTMEKDLKFITGKELRLTMPKVFNAMVSNNIRDNRTNIEPTNLVRLARLKNGKHE